jgi:transcription elongation factor GreA
MVLEEILKNAIIVGAKHKTDAVGIGSIITVKRGKDEKTYTIVGSEEADIAAGKVSNKSPLGEAAMGHRKGDSFSYTTPSGEMNCEILEIK